MANSITSSGTSRTIFGLFTNDIDTSGDISASSFKGNGANITNIRATNIFGILNTVNGGTGNNNYYNNGITYYTNNTLINDNNLQWIENKLIINQRDFQSDSSNYVRSTSNNLINIFSGTNNNLQIDNTNGSNYVLSTSNKLIQYINSASTNNVSLPATANRLGSVIIGDGLYINKAGVISVMPQIIYMNSPTLNNTDSYLSSPIPNTDYIVYKFKYNSLLGTTFDRQNHTINILAIWYKFIEQNLTTPSGPSGLKLILNKGYTSGELTNLELYGDIQIKPIPVTNLNIEYTPLNTTYLEINGVAGTASYCKIQEDLRLIEIFRTINAFKTNWALTISFWLKVNSSNDEILILDFNNSFFLGTNRIVNIKYFNNTLTFFINNNETYFTIPNIYHKYWYHIVWSFERIDIDLIERIASNFKVLVYVNGVEQGNKFEENIFLLSISFNNFFNNTISSTYNTPLTYNFCISDFKIYNYALSITEITELYNANNYTQYNITFNNSETICDIIAYGGGGGGSGGNATSNYGGGAGKLIYINDAYISSGIKILKIGRGGSGYYNNVNFNQVSSVGNNTSFENLVADGGGTSSNYYYNDLILTKEIIGGCGCGSNGGITSSNINPGLYNLFGGSSNIYIYGNGGGPSGGGGIGSPGDVLNGGNGLFELSNLVNNNIYNIINDDNSKRFFKFSNNVNFKTDFNLINDDIGELYNDNVYIGCGGAGYCNIDNVVVQGVNQLGYNSLNSGCGGKYEENGKNGAFLLRFLTKIDERILPKYIQETSNYVTVSSNIIVDQVTTTSNNIINQVTTTSNNIITHLQNITSVNGSLLWTISTNNLYYNIGNVGIGTDPNNFKFEVAAGTGTTGTAIANRYFNILSGASGAVISVTVTAGGSYTVAPTGVVFTSVPPGVGSGATATASISGGKITSIVVTAGGSGYTSPPTISFTGGNGSGATATAAIVSSAVITSNVSINNVCAKFNSSIWIAGGGSVIASSDRRIKEDIQDINDDTALNMILAIEPKTYNYIDKVIKGDNNVYGFIAQQIKEVIPNAVKIQKEFIPNIFSVADYNWEDNILTLPYTLPFENINIQLNTRIKCYDMSNNAIIVEITRIINFHTFEIKNINYTYDKIFAYGVEVNDFHVLNKEYINTLNVCAVQELNRKIQSQNNQINDLTEKINVLINYFDLSKIAKLEEDMNTLNARMDTIISCMDLSKIAKLEEDMNTLNTKIDTIISCIDLSK